MCVCFLLLLQMSNEIIRLCCRQISLDRIFQGYVISSKQILNDCIQCCLAWKELYLHTSQLHHKYSSPKSYFLSLSLSLSEFCSVLYSTGTGHLELHWDCTVLQQHPFTLHAITEIFYGQQWHMECRIFFGCMHTITGYVYTWVGLLVSVCNHV